MSLNWRTSGDCSLADWRVSIPISSLIRQDGEVDACYTAAQGFTRLCLGMLVAESSIATRFKSDPASNKNALNLRPRGGAGFLTFDSWAEGVAEWKARITDPAYAYAGTQTVADLVHTYAPSSDNNNESAYVAAVESVIFLVAKIGADSMPTPTPGATTLNMTKDLIPYPAIITDIITDAENSAWNSLGKKEVWAFVLHRQLGSNESTRAWFRRGKASTGLTEFGQRASGGQIYLWNSPHGFASPGVSPDRAPWASGVFNVHGDSYGDGLLFEQLHGLNAINGKAEAWEIDGQYNDPWSDEAQQEAAQACACDAHNYGITYLTFPLIPAENNRSFVIWHQEITGPAEKICPGPVVMAATPAWIEKVRAIMKTAQTGTTTEPTPPPKQPKWAPKHPPKTAGPKIAPFRTRLKATKATTPRQFADGAALPTGPDVKAGSLSQIAWITSDDQGNLWVIGTGGSRMLYSAFL